MKTLIDKYVKDQRLYDLVNGKRVVLICPATYLVGKNMGAHFDTYDVVCRVTDLIPCRELRKDYGSRTDIVFDGCDYRSIENNSTKVKQELDIAKQVKLIFLPWADLEPHKRAGKKDTFQCFKEIYVDSGVSIPCSFVGYENFRNIWNTVDCEPNSGFLALVILLCHGVKELLLTGMSFYQESGTVFENHYPGYWASKEVQEAHYTLNPASGHEQWTQINFFKNEILTNCSDCVKIDEYLDNLLKLNYGNVLELGE